MWRLTGLGLLCAPPFRFFLPQQPFEARALSCEPSPSTVHVCTSGAVAALGGTTGRGRKKRERVVVARLRVGTTTSFLCGVCLSFLLFFLLRARVASPQAQPGQAAFIALRSGDVQPSFAPSERARQQRKRPKHTYRYRRCAALSSTFSGLTGLRVGAARRRGGRRDARRTQQTTGDVGREKETRDESK